MTEPRSARREARQHRILAVGLLALSLGIAAASLLGPLVTHAMVYRTSPTTLNQLLGSDVAALVIVSPLTLVTAWLTYRGWVVGASLASGIAVYALYTYSQIIIGQEYLRLPGNVERFFPLLLMIFILAEAVLVLAWRVLPEQPPAMSAHVRRGIGVLLLTISVFLVFGQHLRPTLLAWTDPTSLTVYASSPTPFWTVKLMDLGIVVPSAVAAGIGLLRGASWAGRLVYPLLTGCALLACSVASMAVVMLANDDPDASVGLGASFMLFALILVLVTVTLYRPLLRTSPPDAEP